MRVGKNKLLAIGTIVIWSGELFYASWWLQQLDSYEAVRIEVAHDVLTLGHPVYAQFVYRQAVVLADTHELISLKIPVARTLESGEAIDVSLEREGEVVASWSQQSVPAGIHVIELPLPQARQLRGSLDVVVAAPDTKHEEQDMAIRVFIQEADEHYPAGNYSIANQPKKGDMGLTLMAERTRGASLKQRWAEKPFDVTARIVVLMAAGLLVGGLPWIVGTGESNATHSRR